MSTADITIHEVLAGAYRGGRADLRTLLTHAARSRGAAPLCSIPTNSLIDATTRETRESAPTCPTCLRRWRAALTAEQKINRMATAMARADGWDFAEGLDFSACASPRGRAFAARATAALAAI